MGGVFSNEREKIFNSLATSIQRGKTDEVQSFLFKLQAAKGKPDAGSTDEEKLLKKIDVNERAISGRTPLQHAAFQNQIDVLRLLLQSPMVDPNALGDQDYTALHSAALAKSVRICHELLRFKADPCIAATDGSTALDLARRSRAGSCVRTIEDHAKLWQGWVDYYEIFLVGGQWKPRWMVLLQDRRPNTGHGKGGRLQCSNCRHEQVMPNSVSQFPCQSCGAIIYITAVLQMAFYDPGHTTAAMIVPDVAMPEQVVRLPQFQNRMQACELDDAGLGSTLKNLFQGKINRVIQNSALSQRSYGLKVKLSSNGVEWKEHSFRVQEDSDRKLLIRILRDPVVAAYEAFASLQAQQAPQAIPVAQAQLIQPPPPPPPRESPAPPPTREPPGGATPWSCGRCTYRHEGDLASLTNCTMCDFPRGSDLPVSQAVPVPPPSAPDPSIVFSQDAPASRTDLGDVEPRKPTYALLPQRGQPVANVSDPAPVASTTLAVPPVAPPAQSTASQPSGETNADDESGMCSICLERKADAAVIPCGHMCACYDCLEAVKTSARPECPLCRGPVSSILKIYAG